MAEKQVNRYAENILACSEHLHCRREVVLEDHSLVHILSGELKVIQADRTYAFDTGDTFLLQRNQLSTLLKYAKGNLPYRAIMMRFTTAHLREYYRVNTVEKKALPVHGMLRFPASPLLDGFFASILPYLGLEQPLPEKLVYVKMEEAIEILRSIYPHIDGVLSDFYEAGKIDLADFMEKNYMFNIPLEKFSYLTGRSLTTFKRDFKKSFHISPQRWLTQKRLSLAHYQLAQQQRRPVDVYYETGFENLSHFSRAFKKQFGYAPTAVVQHS